MSENHSYLIVGAFYRAQSGECPAPAILKILPVNTQLYLKPEPENPVDKNAIAVWLKMDDFPTLDTEQSKFFSGLLADCGWTSEDLDEPEYKLGFIPATAAAQLRLAGETQGELTFDLNGKPKVSFETA